MKHLVAIGSSSRPAIKNAKNNAMVTAAFFLTRTSSVVVNGYEGNAALSQAYMKDQWKLKKKKFNKANANLSQKLNQQPVQP